MKKLLILSTLLVAVLAVVGVVFALSNGGGTKDTVMAKGIIEYSVYDASGNLKEHKVIHNALTTAGKNDTRDRLFADTQPTLGATTQYDGIRLIDTTPIAGDALSANIDADEITSVQGGTNPGEDLAVVTSTDAEAVIEVKFTTTGTAQTSKIRRLELVKGESTTLGAAIFATQGVVIDLVSGDVITFKWTVNVTG